MISVVVPHANALINSRALFPIVFISLILLSYCYVGNQRRGPLLSLKAPQPFAPRNESDDRVKQQNCTIFYPWPHDDDPDCATYFVQLARNSTFKPRALVSFPGSGNSWLRYLIEASTGYFTGSVFQDQRLYDSGLRGEFRAPNDGSTIVQKTHHDTIYNETKERMEAYVKLSEVLFEYKGILLIRNPYDALHAYWNFIKTKTHKGIVEKPSLNSTEWRHFVASGSEKWTSLISSWVAQSPDLLIVLYEDLKEDPLTELKHILQYLHQPIDPKRMECVRKYAEGPFHRESGAEKFNQTIEEAREGSGMSGTGLRPEIYPETVALNSIVQDSIDRANHVLEQSRIPVRLNYTGSVL